MLKGKTILLGVTGSIAAYKVAYLASALKKQHANVHVLMTPNATKFISPLTFESLTGNKSPVDTFDRNFQFSVEHVALAKQADLFVVVPATANVMAKLAHGLADDMLTTTVLACDCPKMIVPAMNTRMYENPITQANIETLYHFGWKVLLPVKGELACGDVGAGKMPEPEVILEEIIYMVSHPRDLYGTRLLVTAGATQESIDPVRYITNHSTGKMGFAIAQAAAARGAEVVLISGPTNLPLPRHVTNVPVTTAQDMFEAVKMRYAQNDVIIKAAAVADYRPDVSATEKIKKHGGPLTLNLVPTTDILAWLGENRLPGQFICGFSMETQNLVENSRRKLEQKKVDLIAANLLTEPDAGFAADTNVLTLITPESEISLPRLTKYQASMVLLDEILKRLVKDYDEQSSLN